MTTRIKGTPGHLIVVDNERGDGMMINRQLIPMENRDQANLLYEFLHRHVNFDAVVRRLFLMLRDEFPEWKDQRQEDLPEFSQDEEEEDQDDQEDDD